MSKEIFPEILRLRAALLEKTRVFFKEKGVLEVETPALSHSPAIELHSEPFITDHSPSSTSLYLQPSPEYAMKRLLASGTGPIYQISRVFRNEETGPLHNPEFTMIEWYRPGFSLEELMGEVEELIGRLLGVRNAEKMTYAHAFITFTGLEPHTASIKDMRDKTGELGLAPPALGEERDGWLDFLLTHIIEPNLGFEQPIILYDYPASQASLARIRAGDPPVAERFELYINGIELCNGFHELLDPEELHARFKQTNRLRKINQKSELPVDGNLIEALEHGLPPCSGVSVGFDRVVMLAASVESIQEIIAFPFERA